MNRHQIISALNTATMFITIIISVPVWILNMDSLLALYPLCISMACALMDGDLSYQSSFQTWRLKHNAR